MSPDTLEEQLVKYLTDIHAIERQALVQMKAAPAMAGDPRIASAFSDHLVETEGHEQLIAQRLEANGARPSKLKDLAGTLTGAGFGAFAKAQPDTPGKLVAHAFSYEHMEEAAYDLLGRVAQRAADEATADAASLIEGQERAMGDRLAACFDAAVDAALRELDPDDLPKQLDKYLADAHAIEAQALVLLGKAPDLAGSPELASAYSSHRAQTEEHQQLVAARLDARGASPSKLKDAALSLGALNWGAFFGAQPDTPAKLAAFTYAFEHLEVAAYELLRRVAAKVGDEATEHVADRILGEENAAAAQARSLFDQALEASLAEQGVAAR
jgi:ferritin-like metal-binding protein YciE